MNGLAKTVVMMALLAVFTVPSATQGASRPVNVFVSIPPQAYCVERIGGSAVDVDVLVGPGHEPSTYEPTPKQMARLGQAQVYFRIGTPFEDGFIGKIEKIFKGLRIVDTRQGVPLRYFDSPSGKAIPDPHIWLDPKRMKIQADTIYRTLRETDPGRGEMYKKNLQAFEDDLDALDGKIARTLAPLRGRTVYVFHPAFGYFCDSYGLTQVSIEEEGKEPSPKQLARLITRARHEGVKVIFVQPEFSTKNARVIAQAIGGAVVPMDPLAGDYLTNLETMAERLKSALSVSH
jgi:zinc transport system substrate-binding protein